MKDIIELFESALNKAERKSLEIVQQRFGIHWSIREACWYSYDQEVDIIGAALIEHNTPSLSMSPTESICNLLGWQDSQAKSFYLGWDGYWFEDAHPIYWEAGQKCWNDYLAKRVG